MKCSCHLALTSPSFFNSLSLPSAFPTFFGPSFHNLLAASVLSFGRARSIFSFMCDTVYTVVLVLPKTPLLFLCARVWLCSSTPPILHHPPSSLVSSFPLSFPNFPCWSMQLLHFLFFFASQYTQCRFIVAVLILLYVVSWVRLLTVLVVICFPVVLVWRLKDMPSLFLSSSWNCCVISGILSLLSSFLGVPTCFLLVLFKWSLATVIRRMWSLPSQHLYALLRLQGRLQHYNFWFIYEARTQTRTHAKCSENELSLHI